MKFILTEDIDNNPTPEEVEELKDSVKAELVEELEHDPALIPTSIQLIKLLDDFIYCVEGLNNKDEFLDNFEIENLKTSLEILKEFKFSYSLFQNRRLKEIRRRYEERNKK